MKKLKYLLIICLLFITTGCLKIDKNDNIKIVTTSYPIEYITNYLYGDHSEITSIYPDGTNISTYTLNDLQLKEFSKSDMYVFNGLSAKEQDYVNKIFKKNKNIMIIDASSSIGYSYDENELWLNPSNVLMLSRNVKNGLSEYVTSKLLKEEIEKKYNELKIKISNIDAELNTIYENAKHKYIITDNDTLKFLERYGFTVISLESHDGVSEKNLADARNLINNGTVKYIFTLNGTEVNKYVADIKNTTRVELLEMNSLSNLSDKQRSEKEDYFSLINENIEMLKKELY